MLLHDASTQLLPNHTTRIYLEPREEGKPRRFLDVEHRADGSLFFLFGGPYGRVPRYNLSRLASGTLTLKPEQP